MANLLQVLSGRSSKWTVTIACLLMLAVGAYGQSGELQLSLLGTYQSGVFNEGAAEIVAYDPVTARLFISNAVGNSITVLDISDPTNPVKVNEIDLNPYGASVNSVAVANGIVATAVQADPRTRNGKVVLFDTEGNFIRDYSVGALPDMVVFTPDGNKILVAVEGEPSDDYSIDPEGGVCIIDITNGPENGRILDPGFGQFKFRKQELIDAGVRIFGPNANVAEDLEPEYIAVSGDGKTAYVTLQENNALGILDLESVKFTAIKALGFKDHSVSGNGIDASDRDDAINIAKWPVFGMYQPDAIAWVEINGEGYLVTANEGDARDYDAFAEEERVADLTLDPTAFPDAEALQADEALGRLTVTSTLGDVDGDGDFDELYVFGGRSFSIWDSEGNLVWDSGDELEQIIAQELPDDFNANNDENGTFDNRSDNKGPEPEGITVQELNGQTYAFVALERVGGAVIYNITNPLNPEFVTYRNNRDFSIEFDPDQITPEVLAQVGDLGPEALIVITADESPVGSDLLVVTHEVSGSVSIFAIESAPLNNRLIGISEVVLDGVRSHVSTRETNLGNLIADAMRWQAKQLAADLGVGEPAVAIQSGGAIGNDSEIPAGNISELLTHNIMPLGNLLSVVETISPRQFKEIMENAVSRVEDADGRFAQISGFKIECNTSGVAQVLDDDGNVVIEGSRIVSIILDDGTTIIVGGVVADSAPNVNIAIADFLALGGDQYPFRGAPFTRLGISDQQTLAAFIQDGLGGVISAADYPEAGENRIVETAVTSVSEDLPTVPTTIPQDYALEQNYPNPFNPSTVISFAMPQAGHVELAVYDVLGREVARLVDGERPAGYHSVVFNASTVSTGLYFYKIEAADFTQVRKMLLTK